MSTTIQRAKAILTNLQVGQTHAVSLYAPNGNVYVCGYACGARDIHLAQFREFVEKITNSEKYSLVYAWLCMYGSDNETMTFLTEQSEFITVDSSRIVIAG